MTRRLTIVMLLAALLMALAAPADSHAQTVHPMKIDATGLMPTQFSIDGRHFQGTSVETIELAQGGYRLDPGSGLVMRCELTVTGAGAWDFASECDSFLAGRGSDTLRLVGFAVTVDPSPLSTPIFFTGMSLAPFDGPRQLRLLPTINPYFAQPGAGTVGACHFNLAFDGTFTYPDELEGCLSGRGTGTLTYDGVPVNIDARQLSTTLFSFGQAVALVDQPTGVIQPYRLLPTFTTTHYSFFTPRGVAWPSLGLRVGLDGRIDYPASADGWVSGRGTDTLVIRGYPVQIDATATAPGTFEIPDAAGVGVLDRGVVHHLRLPPVTYMFGTRLQAEFTFSIREQDGRVEVPAGAGPCVSGAGSAGLTVGCAAAPPPPPPSPPAPSAGRNVSPPTIEFAARVAGGTNYRCNPGTWEGLPRTRLFEYTWYRVGSISGWLDGVPRATPTAPVATGPTYVLPRADYGKRYYCEVSAISLAGRSPSAFSATTVLTGRDETIGGLIVGGFYGDFRIRGIDVFQIAQARPGAQMFGAPGSPSQPSTGPFPALCGGGTPTSWLNCLSPANPQRTSYAGVALDQRKTTTAIVYVDMNGALATDPSELEITLSASVGTHRLSGARTQRDSLPPTSPTPWVTAAQRADRQWGQLFTIPASWLASAVLADQPLDLEATVSLAVGAGGGYLRECPLQVLVGGAAGCSANNRYRLDDVPVFDDLPDLTVRSLPLLTPGQNVGDLTPPERLMRQAVKLWPGGERMTILPYKDSVDIDPMALTTASDFCKPYGSDLRWCRQAHVMSALDGWWLRDVSNRSGYNLLLGVHRYAGEPGFSRPGTTLASVGQMPTMTANDGLPQAAAHEFGHTLGFNHAGRTCGSHAGGQVGDPWVPDDGGRLQGIGFDRSAVRRFGVPDGIAYRALRDDDANPDFDLMSYCGSSARRWLSAYNWNRAFATLRAIDAARRTPRASAARKLTAATAQAGQALATGVIGPQGGRFARVIPAGPGSFTPEGDPASPLRVRALDARGNLLLEVAPDVQMLKDSDGVGTFVASIPAGADAVELRSGATTLDRRERSQPPTVRATAPRRDTRVGARQRLTVRWVARDPDGGELHATVEYSPDGRHWRPVLQGPSRGRASIPGRFLEAGMRARVRVTVDDGFNHAGAVSAAFRAAGTPPAPRIVLPAQGESPQAGRVLLHGAAIDDRGRRLPGRALTWFAGSSRLGRGERVTATLPPGRVKVRLTAHDRLGRLGTAARKLVVEPVALRLRALRVPDSVKARARAVPISLATAAPATARAGGRTWSVGPRARTLRIPLPARPRTGLLKVTLRLTAHGQALRQTLVILRR